ncbi:hypothetical protein KAR91_15905 [Candidatus Pacearchaeota archaeon]|nr:hypothetical protein [Candidatus Pacearchaeota archaeon]
MLSIGIFKDTLFKINEHSKRDPKSRIIGIFLGRLVNETLMVEDAVSGKMKMSNNKVALQKEAIARIADGIINQRIEGNIIGWYHSHPGYGVFMSEVDLNTQKTLNQFSPNILAIVYDPSTEEFGFFAFNFEKNYVERISNEFIQIFGAEEKHAFIK